MSDLPRGSGGRIAHISYPSSSTGRAQRLVSSGQYDVTGERRRIGDPACMLNVNVSHGTSGERQFRRRGEMVRVIETIYGQGNIHRRRDVGRMETTDHGTILKVLERQKDLGQNWEWWRSMSGWMVE